MFCDPGKNITCLPFYVMNNLKCLSTVCSAANCQLCPYLRAHTCITCHSGFTLNKENLCQPISQKPRHLQLIPNGPFLDNIRSNLTNELRDNIQQQINPLLNSTSQNTMIPQFPSINISLIDQNKIPQSNSLIF
jgi:hypothetical protein